MSDYRMAAQRLRDLRSIILHAGYLAQRTVKADGLYEHGPAIAARIEPLTTWLKEEAERLERIDDL